MSVHDSPLGKHTQYVAQYAPDLLHPIPRALNRQALGISCSNLPFTGVDIWNGYELSWLNPKGKPQVTIVEFRIPCDSLNIIESKSFKLYLNSFNQTRFASSDEVRELLKQDLAKSLGMENTDRLHVTLMPVTDPFELSGPGSAICIDNLDVDITQYHPDAELLAVNPSERVCEVLVSHLLKSNCPVTGQPDWASLVVGYEGGKICRESLLRYVVSFREHQDFHEHCVERIFCDLLDRCSPDKLSVYARYTRRGGLDINPFRSTHETAAPNVRLIRQ